MQIIHWQSKWTLSILNCCWICFALMLPINACAIQDGYLQACQDNSYLRCEEVKAICSRITSVAIPAADKPTEIEKRKLVGCSSKEEYYGYGKSPDMIKARKCAYLEYEQGDPIDETFAGSSILMMIYANGRGVKRNIDLALKFACEDGKGQIAEYESHILHLEDLRNNEKEFDFCDDSESLLMTGRCADRDAEISKAEREGKLAKLLSSWSESERKGFEGLRAIWQSYLLVSDEEIDHTGTMGVAEGISAKNAMEERFLESLIGFEQGKFPSFSDREFTKADQELNSIYKRIQNASEDDVIRFAWGTVTKEKVKKVQRAWLRYRDAWVEFAKHKYPAIPAASWKTWLTRGRARDLKSLIEDR